ncbi:hypothetical protein E2C01_081535 [Portunus trituberculatus]|uniref:Uncharacterized protein n=1 Tax=Portunus trituberculatus TaxID=210409 RepID=A0A5B7IWW4_PORTR|nr:hypothetical protein [Portunus trituberculatus]
MRRGKRERERQQILADGPTIPVLHRLPHLANICKVAFEFLYFDTKLDGENIIEFLAPQLGGSGIR